ncbi:MAG TPA: DNA-3-methyladenine glycosylase I [Chroococcales cyanobacterium]
MKKYRCAWADNNDLMRQYHDDEWGVPINDSRELWETLILDGFQAGLSWQIVLNRREGFRSAFKNFVPEKIAIYKEKDIERLMADERIIRARAKIEATISNARAYIEMQKAGDDFSGFVWDLAGGKPIQSQGKIYTQTPLSVTMSKALKKKGFKFVGPVIVYAWMQAVGIVNDHEHECFRYEKCRTMGKNFSP